jgi:hypothetical protein
LYVVSLDGAGGDIERFAFQDHSLRNHLHGLNLHQPFGLKTDPTKTTLHDPPQERCHQAIPERWRQVAVVIIVVMCRVGRDFLRKRTILYRLSKAGQKRPGTPAQRRNNV